MQMKIDPAGDADGMDLPIVPLHLCTENSVLWSMEITSPPSCLEWGSGAVDPITVGAGGIRAIVGACSLAVGMVDLGFMFHADSCVEHGATTWTVHTDSTVLRTRW